MIVLNLKGISSQSELVYKQVSGHIEVNSRGTIVFAIFCSFLVHIVPTAVASYYNYFVLNKGESSFELPLPQV